MFHYYLIYMGNVKLFLYVWEMLYYCYKYGKGYTTIIDLGNNATIIDL